MKTGLFHQIHLVIFFSDFLLGSDKITNNSLFNLTFVATIYCFNLIKPQLEEQIMSISALNLIYSYDNNERSFISDEVTNFVEAIGACEIRYSDGYTQKWYQSPRWRVTDRSWWWLWLRFTGRQPVWGEDGKLNDRHAEKHSCSEFKEWDRRLALNKQITGQE